MTYEPTPLPGPDSPGYCRRQAKKTPVIPWHNYGWRAVPADRPGYVRMQGVCIACGYVRDAA